MSTKFVKDGAAVLDYVVDWSAWLGDDTITDATFTADTPVDDDTGLAVDDLSSFDTTSCTIWVSGGTTGRTYTVVCQIVTLGGRTDERTITFQIKEL